jgi:hypothetical protein
MSEGRGMDYTVSHRQKRGCGGKWWRRHRWEYSPPGHVYADPESWDGPKTSDDTPWYSGGWFCGRCLASC